MWGDEGRNRKCLMWGDKGGIGSVLCGEIREDYEVSNVGR